MDSPYWSVNGIKLEKIYETAQFLGIDADIIIIGRDARQHLGITCPGESKHLIKIQNYISPNIIKTDLSLKEITFEMSAWLVILHEFAHILGDHVVPVINPELKHKLETETQGQKNIWIANGEHEELAKYENLEQQITDLHQDWASAWALEKYYKLVKEGVINE